MKKEKLIIICVAILAVAFIWSQVAKQNSIELQAQMKIDQENKVLAIEKAKEDKIASDEAFNRLMINSCIESADTDYWSFMKLNGTENKDGSITAQTRYWDDAKENKKDAIDLCYKKYN
jgi:hypothetical protein